jgi:predicted alpha/beta superfamily hydrolase
MKTVFSSKWMLILAGLFVAINLTKAQQTTVINDSIYSNQLKEWRRIRIKLPEEYKPGDGKRYDVVYMTDGEWSYDVFSYDYKFAKDENFLPPLILVALPNVYTAEGNMRDRDFLPEKMEDNPRAGGADNFIAFLKDEAIPYIDETYPTSGENSLFGHSYGGLFSMYVLLKEPGLFTNYYCSDPAFQWKNQRMVALAKEVLKQSPELNKTLWINGIEETYRSMGDDRMDSVLQAFAPKGLRWKITYYPNETHNSVRLKGIYDGLKYTYSGYMTRPMAFHPMNGSLLQGKPTRIYLAGNYPDVHYTTDGSEPETSSMKAQQVFEITGPAKLIVKSFGENKKFSSMAKGNFELSETWPALPTVKKAKKGGLHYAYYEGTWDKMPDFAGLKPVKSGIADSVFSLDKLPSQTGFGCVFEGYLKIDVEGYYIFALSSDDGAKLFLGGREIINNDGIHGSDNLITYVVPLQIGFYPVRIEYFQGGGGRQLNLLCLPPNQDQPNNLSFKMMYYK